MHSLNTTPQPDDIIKGRLTHVEYQDDQSAFVVIQVLSDNQNYRAVGELIEPCLYTTLSLSGQWEADHNGQLFYFHDYLSKPPTNAEHLVHYIELKTDIDRRYSQSLVSFVGTDILGIIDTNPNKLLESGVPKPIVQHVVNTFSQRSGYEKIRQALNFAGIPIEKLSALHRILGEQIDLTAALEQNPFLLYLWFTDISFFDVQRIARYRKVPLGHATEIQAACLAALRFALNIHGHTAQSYTQLASTVHRILSLKTAPHEDDIKRNIHQLPKKLVTATDTYAAVSECAEHEKNIFNALKKRLDENNVDSPFVTDRSVLEELSTFTGHHLNCLESAIQKRTITLLCHTIAGENTLLQQLALTFQAHHAETLFVSAYPQQSKLIEQIIPYGGSILAEDVYGVTPSGTPIHSQKNPTIGEVFVLSRVSSYPIHILDYLLNAIPPTASIILTGTHKGPTSPISGDIRQLLLSIPELPYQDLNKEDPTPNIVLGEVGLNNASINAIPCTWTSLLNELPNIILAIADTMNVDPIEDVLVVLPKNTLASGEKLNVTLQLLLATTLLPDRATITWLEQQYVVGEPVLTSQATLNPPSPAYTRATIDGINAERELSLTAPYGNISLPNSATSRLTPGFTTPVNRLIAGSTKVVICCIHPEHINLVTTHSLPIIVDSATVKTFLLGAINTTLPAGSQSPRSTTFHYPLLEDT